MWMYAQICIPPWYACSVQLRVQTHPAFVLSSSVRPPLPKEKASSKTNVSWIILLHIVQYHIPSGTSIVTLFYNKTNLRCFHGAQGNVCKEFRRCRGCQIQWRPPYICILFSQQIRIQDFEDLIQTKLEKTLKYIRNVKLDLSTHITLPPTHKPVTLSCT